MTRGVVGRVFRRGASAGRPVVNAVRFLLVVLGISIGSAATSFLVVYHLGSDQVRTRAVDPAMLHRAQTLRTLTNELVTLCNEFSLRMPAPEGAWSPVNRSWVERVFRREIQLLEQRINDTALPTLGIYVQLQSTTSRCGGMARHLEDRVLRHQTLQEVVRTATEAEAYIDEITQGRAISPPRVRVRFF